MIKRISLVLMMGLTSSVKLQAIETETNEPTVETVTPLTTDQYKFTIFNSTIGCVHDYNGSNEPP